MDMNMDVAQSLDADKTRAEGGNWLFRRLGPDDLEVLLALERQSFNATWGREQLNAALRDQRTFKAFGLEERASGRLSGYCLILAAAGEMEVLNIAIAPELRRAGLGRLLLGFVLQWAGKEGIQNVLLEVRPSNTAARALYAAFGFYQIGKRRGYYQDTGEDALVLHRELGPIAAGDAE